MESLLQDLRAEALYFNRAGKTGMGSLLFDAYNRLIQLSKPVEKVNHGGGRYRQYEEVHSPHGYTRQ